MQCAPYLLYLATELELVTFSPWRSRTDPAALLPSWVQAVSTCFAVQCIHSTVPRDGSRGHGSEAIVCEHGDAAVKRA